MDVREIPAITVHHTEQPDTIVVEFTVDGRSAPDSLIGWTTSRWSPSGKV